MLPTSRRLRARSGCACALLAAGSISGGWTNASCIRRSDSELFTPKLGVGYVMSTERPASQVCAHEPAAETSRCEQSTWQVWVTVVVPSRVLLVQRLATVGVARDDSDASGAPCVHTCESERDCAAADSVERRPGRGARSRESVMLERMPA